MLARCTASKTQQVINELNFILFRPYFIWEKKNVFFWYEHNDPRIDPKNDKFPIFKAIMQVCQIFDILCKLECLKRSTRKNFVVSRLF